MTQSISWGEAGVSGDELETDFTYVSNTSSYIVNKVAKVERRVPGQAALQTEEYEYDGTGNYQTEAAWNVAAVKGNLTAVSRRLEEREPRPRLWPGHRGGHDLLECWKEYSGHESTGASRSRHRVHPRRLRGPPLAEATAGGADRRCRP